MRRGANEGRARLVHIVRLLSGRNHLEGARL
jgi:hypothetical protein